MARVFILTTTDDETEYMSERWGRPLLRPQGAGAGSDFELLENPSRNEVEGSLSAEDGLVFFGHGVSEALGSPALVDLANVNLLTGRVVAVACRSARVLGPAAVAGGVGSYVGFIGDVPVIASSLIDSLMRDGFAQLLADEESVHEFEDRFTAACEEIQSEHFSYRRNDSAFMIGLTAAVLQLGLRVLEASESTAPKRFRT